MAWTSPASYSVNEVLAAAKLNTYLRDNTREIWRELAYVEFTSNVSVTSAHTESSPVDVVSAGAITFTAEPILIEFLSPILDNAASSGIYLSLWDASTDLGRIWATDSGEVGARPARRLTPTAASHTYKIRAWLGAGTGTSTVFGGAGGVGLNLPGFIRITQKGTT